MNKSKEAQEALQSLDYEWSVTVGRMQETVDELRAENEGLVDANHLLGEEKNYWFNLGKEIAIEKAELASCVTATIIKYDNLNSIERIGESVKEFHDQMEVLRKELEKQTKD